MQKPVYIENRISTINYICEFVSSYTLPISVEKSYWNAQVMKYSAILPLKLDGLFMLMHKPQLELLVRISIDN